MPETIRPPFIWGRSIFIKIYLCFLLAIVLVIAMQLLLDKLTDSGPFRSRGEPAPVADLTSYGKVAVEKYVSNDRKGLLHASDQLSKERKIDAYIVDQNNSEINNLHLPPRATILAAKVRQSGKPEDLPVPPAFLVGVPVTGPDNKVYVVLGETRPGEFGPHPEHGGPPREFGQMDPAMELPIRLLILLTVSGLVCYLFARYLTSPLISLREATRRFATGDLKARVGNNVGGRKDEIADLANDFDMMATRIESLMTAQRQLLGDISHELRTPLTRLNLALELARNQAGPDADKSLNRVEQESECLNELIGELLTFARMETSLEEKTLTPFDITGLIQDVVLDAEFEAGQTNRSVQFSGDIKYFVIGDQGLLRRAIENVVRNALRYTPENSMVGIDTKLMDPDKDGKSCVEIAVRDSGPGVPNAELSNIFRPFYRISNARDRKSGGVGLGLAITERAVRLHGGSVTARNAADGGLIVTITLPISAS